MTDTTVVPFKRQPRSYEAKLMRLSASGLEIHIAGTLDGFLDFAIIDGTGNSSTYSLTCDDARRIAAALVSAVHDVQAHCLFDADPLLVGDVS